MIHHYVPTTTTTTTTTTTAAATTTTTTTTTTAAAAAAAAVEGTHDVPLINDATISLNNLRIITTITFNGIVLTY